MGSSRDVVKRCANDFRLELGQTKCGVYSDVVVFNGSMSKWEFSRKSFLPFVDDIRVRKARTGAVIMQEYQLARALTSKFCSCCFGVR